VFCPSKRFFTKSFIIVKIPKEILVGGKKLVLFELPKEIEVFIFFLFIRNSEKKSKRMKETGSATNFFLKENSLT